MLYLPHQYNSCNIATMHLVEGLPDYKKPLVPRPTMHLSLLTIPSLRFSFSPRKQPLHHSSGVNPPSQPPKANWPGGGPSDQATRTDGTHSSEARLLVQFLVRPHGGLGESTAARSKCPSKEATCRTPTELCT